MSCPHEAQMGARAKNVARILAVLVIAAVVLVCVMHANRRLETGTIACSVFAAAAVLSFFSWVTTTTANDACLKASSGCPDVEAIQQPAAQAINWMASFIALFVVLRMYRAQSGAWSMVGAYAAISVAGLVLSMVFASWVQSTIGVDGCQRPDM